MKKQELEFKFNGETDWEKMGCLNELSRIKEIRRIAREVKKSDRSILRYIIEQNIEYSAELELTPQHYRLALLCLFKIMEIEDTVLFYKAKFEADFDTGFEACPEMIVGKEKDQTIKYLHERKHNEIIEYLEELDYSVLSSYEEFCLKADKYIEQTLKNIETQNLKVD